MPYSPKASADDLEAAPAFGERKSKRRKRSRGFSKKEVSKILKRGGKLTMSQMLRCKVRYFTAGFAIGSEDFVNGLMAVIKKGIICMKAHRPTLFIR